MVIQDQRCPINLIGLNSGFCEAVDTIFNFIAINIHISHYITNDFIQLLLTMHFYIYPINIALVILGISFNY